MLIPSNRTKRECILSRLCFLVLSVWVSLPSAAQNNPYKIDDALYPIYQRASRQARQQEGLLVADTLYQQALKLGDKKAQCLAYIIPLQFYMSQKDDSKIEKASTDLKEISRANNYLQYYYYAWSSEIIYFLNQQRSLLALQKAEKMKKQAFADRYPYGIFSCIRTDGPYLQITRKLRPLRPILSGSVGLYAEEYARPGPQPTILKPCRILP